ncbi:HopJ type III effector protein [Mucilaginibacter sp. SMC90]|uniref:HopJ type III effector protein n=1 Tax=Mucilaginibacter sp. SMC90 TaxID=2929803 RepID=UPI001FB36128|nr:HopJ type III effector protein [Mucilaginibacter sp. SMC90]UOE52784.1 HopJ type III effector protein [Mucilaginibacter sp. SMC90]
MKEQLSALLIALKEGTATFNEVIEFIAVYYQHQPTAFKNGDVYNETTQNQGSARVFAFAQINNLIEADTLCLFAEHYKAVVATPNGSDHQNIRQFMAHGWEGIEFEGEALIPKSEQA